MKFIVLSALLLLAAAGSTSAQDWRGIRLLHSKCEDVQRALGVDKCEYPRSTYRLKDEVVHITFVTCPCPIVCDEPTQAWNLPPDTVRGIHRELRTGIPIADFQVNGDKWTKTTSDFIGEVIYKNDELGHILSAVDGLVLSITYYAPVDKNRKFLCRKCSVLPRLKEAEVNKEASRSAWVHAYGDVKFDNEKARLDRFAAELKKHGRASRGYIVIYGGCRTQKREAQARVRQAKQYLVTTHGIPSNRVKTIYGGQREELRVELHVRTRGQPPPAVGSSRYQNVSRPAEVN